METETGKVVSSFQAKAKLPGFRPGKAPASLIRKQFQGDIRQQVLENLIPRFLEKRVKEEDLQVVGRPDITKVKFDQVAILESEDAGDAFLGANALDFTISGNTFQVLVPLAFLPSTGADPLSYRFNLWPRTDLTPSNLAAISDFAPNNALAHTSAVPEPGTWLMLLAGFAAMGVMLRYRRRSRGGAQLAISQQA